MKPWLGVVLISLHMPCNTSLKDRRHTVRSLLDRARKHFGVSSSDLGPPEMYQRADLGFSCITSSCLETEERLERLCTFVGNQAEDEGHTLLSVDYEVLAYGDISYRKTE